jgi:cellobiose epimerase
MGRLFFYSKYALMKLAGLFTFGLLMFATERLMAEQSAPSTQPTPEVFLRLAAEVETNLHRDILDKWFPVAFDPHGGFFQDYSEDWTLVPSDSKGIVYESRLTWTSAEAAMRFPAKSEMYLAQSRHGLAFLSEKMWDQKKGGFFWGVDDDGNPAGELGARKQGYGNAFGIFGAAVNYKATHDAAALDLAKKAFRWYDEHGHDAKNGGYLEVVLDDPADANSVDDADPIGAGANGKSMNTSIHVLEALTALYEVWPDPTVRARLQEMFEIVRDKIYADPGYLVMFFAADWKPRAGEDSYGHDVETAYLLTEAAAALGIPDDQTTWLKARKLVDHSLQYGLDHERGGLYNEGGVTGGDYADQREWWVEAEWLNALLLMHERYGHETPQYWNAFIQQWNWINQYGMDKVNGGWYPRVNNDGTPVPHGKSDAWTDCYHQARAMFNVSARLRSLAGAK